MFLSGPAGSGKSLLVRKELVALPDATVGWIEAGEDDSSRLLSRLLVSIGPGKVSGTPAELRNILHVYLQHQTARGRRTIIVADGVERDAIDVIKEIEALSMLRHRAMPVVQIVMTTRNEELVAQFTSRKEAGRLALAHHQRYAGFTMEETEAYLRSVFRGAGCEWFDELIPKDLVLEIQAFTQGVVGDIDALCRESLEILAKRSGASIRQSGLDVGMLKEAAKKLRLRYDPAAWKIQHEEVLQPSAVKQSRRDNLRIEAAHLTVSSAGRQIAEVTLNRPRMVLGRDRNCDISLESSYVSRFQNLFMETPDGWMLIDLNSTNGCFVNGRKVSEHKLRDGDLITLGQHHIRFSGNLGRLRNIERDETEETLKNPANVSQ
ncbi:MAG: FHA domain-containing protein [Gammaproteobacteria bacterium]|nr:FHA domain-containing protein [Gammaproteobacteria bacterium]